MFRFIVDTNDTIHYLKAKYLANLLKPFATNQFIFDDSFNTARKTNKILKV